MVHELVFIIENDPIDHCAVIAFVRVLIAIVFEPLVILVLSYVIRAEGTVRARESSLTPGNGICNQSIYN